jgi:hypothetical protein
LNSTLGQIPLNTVGELYIGGRGLLKEYLDPEHTKVNIIQHPKFGRLYKTCDLVKLQEDGNIMYVGRSDFQVKMRGQRLEIGEIESIIMNDKRVTNCVIIKHEMEGQEHLVAYIETIEDVKEELKEECKRKLRSYMVPTIWMMMEQFPLNKNGKVDRKSLPDPVLQETEYIPPQTEIEHFVINCINKLFPNRLISMNDDLIVNLGCNSHDFMTLLNLLRNKFNSISIADLFKHTQINDLCKYKNDDDIFT